MKRKKVRAMADWLYQQRWKAEAEITELKKVDALEGCGVDGCDKAFGADVIEAELIAARLRLANALQGLDILLGPLK